VGSYPATRYPTNLPTLKSSEAAKSRSYYLQALLHWLGIYIHPATFFCLVDLLGLRARRFCSTLGSQPELGTNQRPELFRHFPYPGLPAMDSSHAHEDFFPAILQDCIGALARKLGVPLGDRLAQHAADKQHEDVENDTDISPSSRSKHSKCLYEYGNLTSFFKGTPPNDRVANGPDRLTSFLPPFNFGSVVDGRIYRSAYPKEENFEFLRKLKLKTIL